jgi:hypothetical protein
LFHLRDQYAIYGAVGEVVIHSGGNGLHRGIELVSGHMMSLDQHLQAVAVGRDIAAESPFLAQDAIEQPGIDMRRDAVDLVVRSHYAADFGFFDRDLKRHEEILSNNPLGIIAGRCVGAALGLAVHGEVLGGRDDVRAADQERIPLQPFDCGNAHARCQEGIFTVRFLGTSLARIAGDIQHRREDLARPGGASFFFPRR